MANSKEFREKKDQAFEAYLAGKTDPKDLARLVGCSHVTIGKWIRSGKWAEIGTEERLWNKRIAAARKKALLVALECYAKDPMNANLSSLVSMLRAEQRKELPGREINEYIVQFLDQTTDFFIEKGYIGLLKEFQHCMYDLAEYLRKRNG